MQATAKTLLVGVFDDRMEAERAVDELEQAGFTHDSVAFVLRGGDVARGGTLTDAVGTKDEHGAVTGAIAGGVFGGLLGAAAALVIPGVGPVIAGGILATSLGYAGAGMAIGGLLGAMKGAGMSEAEAQFYEHQFRSGKAIVTVNAGDREAAAAAILKKHGGYDMHAESERSFHQQHHSF